MNQISPINQLPQELYLKVFSYFSPEELTSASSVCKNWLILASDQSLWNVFDLKKIFPSLKVINEKVWKDHANFSDLGISIENLQDLKKTKSQFLNQVLKLKKLFPAIENNAGVTLLTIPKDLTFNNIVKFAEAKGIVFRYIWNQLSKELGDIPVKKTYQIAITNNIFKESRNSSIKKEKEMLAETNCRIPHLVEAISLMILSHLNSQNYLYGEKPSTHTYCLEQIDGNRIFIGSFGQSGLIVSCSKIPTKFKGVGGVVLESDCLFSSNDKGAITIHFNAPRFPR